VSKEHIYLWRKRDKGEGISTRLLPGTDLAAKTDSSFLIPPIVARAFSGYMDMFREVRGQA